MFRSIKQTVLTALVITYLSNSVWAQDEVSLKPYILEEVSAHAFILTLKEDENSHFNFGIIIGDDGVTLINSGMHYHTETIDKAVQNVTQKPIVRVINTNYDPYNHRGNKYFADKGATILSHEALKYTRGYFQTFFSGTTKLDTGTDTITLYPAKAHSLGYVLVHLEQANVLFISDAYRTDWITVMGPHGIEGHLNNIKHAISLSDENTKIVSGGGGNIISRDSKGLVKELQVRKSFISLAQAHLQSGLTAGETAGQEDIKNLLKENYPQRDWSSDYLVGELIQTDLTPKHIQSPSERGVLLGTYENTDGLKMEIIWEGGNYYVRSLGNFNFKLLPITSDKMILQSVEGDNYLTFAKSESDSKSMITSTINNGWYSRLLPSTEWVKK